MQADKEPMLHFDKGLLRQPGIEQTGTFVPV